VISFFTDASTNNELSQYEDSTAKESDTVDPKNVMEDVESNYSAARMHDDSSMAVLKHKMTKKDMAAFMKEKLKQTKISSEAKSLQSATGPPQKNFKPFPQVSQSKTNPTNPIKRPPVKAVKGRKESSESSEGDIKAAAERMNRPLKSQASRKNLEHSSRVIDTSKNIYKPCFNMPAKDKQPEPVKRN
jgi:hypothetical protein